MTATAADRVERILSVLPWIVETPGSTVEEICNRFGLQESELRSDLDLLMYEVGIHPFTPDARVDVIFDDDRVYIHLGDYFRRPLRLTADEAIALYAGGRALLDRPDRAPDPVLGSAVAKLGRVLGVEVATQIDIRLGEADPEVLATVRDATDAGRRISIDYYSFGRDQRSVREVDPVRLVAEGGHWYLLAWCLRSAGMRRFRVDRISHAVDTGEAVGVHPDVAGTVEDDLALSDAPLVDLVVDASDEWIVDTFPTEALEEIDDGRLRIRVRVTADAWLQRLLLRLDPTTEATDVATGADLTALRTSAAESVHRRYT